MQLCCRPVRQDVAKLSKKSGKRSRNRDSHSQSGSTRDRPIGYQSDSRLQPRQESHLHFQQSRGRIVCLFPRSLSRSDQGNEEKPILACPDLKTFLIKFRCSDRRLPTLGSLPTRLCFHQTLIRLKTKDLKYYCHCIILTYRNIKIS